MKAYLPLFFSSCLLTAQAAPFEPTWESMKNYECPDWFRDAKLGIFLHWGVNSVPGFDGHYGRHMYWQEKPDPVKGTGWTESTPLVYKHHIETYGHPTQFGYKDFIPMWKAEKFDAEKLADFFKSCGARYIVPMAVHHDNFDNWNSRHHKWNSVEMGPKIDIIGEWKKACRQKGLKFGVSTHFNGGHEHVFFQGGADTSGPLKGKPYDSADPQYEDFYHKRSADRRKIDSSFGKQFLARHLDLIDSYKPDLLYFDGGLPYGENGMQIGAYFMNVCYEQSQGRLNGVLNLKRGFPKGAATLDIEKGQADRLFEEPWQTDTTINSGWFYLGTQSSKGAVDAEKSSRDQSAVKKIKSDGLRMTAGLIVDNLADIVSKNGNMLLNVGQKADGSIAQIYLDELQKVGAWLKVNGEAIYGTRPWKIYGEGPTQIKTGFDTEPLKPWSSEDIRFTTKGDDFYAIVLDWPEDGVVEIRSLSTAQKDVKPAAISLLGRGVLAFEMTDEALKVKLPQKKVGDFAHVLKIQRAK